MRTPSAYQTAILEAVKTGTGDIIVNAVAGSGKTTTLLMAAAELQTDNALFCAFSKDVQMEIEKRVTAQGSCMTTKTMHSIGMAAVRNYLKGFRRNIKVDDEKYDLLIKPVAVKIHEKLMTQYRADIRRRLPVEEPVDFGTLIGWIKSLVRLIRCTLIDYKSESAVYDLADHYGVEIDSELMTTVHQAVIKILDEGCRIAGETGVIDFTDMIYLPARWELDVEQYDFVFVDECQDLSKAQLSIALKCRAEGGRMLFVGDRRQSIYGFTGADPESFNSIIEQTGAQELPLSICYRCPVSVIQIAQQIVPEIESAPDADAGIVADIAMDTLPALVRTGDMILCRKVAPLIGCCIALIGARIPARVKGRDIAKGLTTIVKEVAKRRGFIMQDFYRFLTDWSREKINKIERIGKSVESKSEKVDDSCLGIMAVLESGDYMTPEALISDIEGLFSDGKPAVQLSSIHRAKGLEADNVFLLEADAVQLKFRGMRDWQRYQEECAHYVALTRAMKALYLVPKVPVEDCDGGDDSTDSE